MLRNAWPVKPPETNCDEGLNKMDLILTWNHLLKTLKTIAIWSSTRSAPTLQRQHKKAANAAS